MWIEGHITKKKLVHIVKNYNNHYNIIVTLDIAKILYNSTSLSEGTVHRKQLKLQDFEETLSTFLTQA